MLAKLGYRSIAACDGETAIIIARQIKPAIIFMDLQMPIRDGFEATREIRQLNEYLHRIPIVAVTANATSQDRQRCFEVGMNDYLTKPVNLKALDACMKRWIPQAAPKTAEQTAALGEKSGITPAR
jgi:CheY-like chemotaxis protein